MTQLQKHKLKEAVRSKRLLIISIVAFFTIFCIYTIGYDYTIGDHTYYTTTGTFGDGHDLTLLVLRPMAMMMGDAPLPIFVNFMFVLSVYFMIKPFTKYPEWAFILAGITPLATVYAQVFAISFFNFMLGLYFRNKKKFAPLFLILVFLAHYWTGLFVAGIFALYILAFDRKSLKVALLPTIIITGIFFFLMPQGIGFLTQSPLVLPSGYLTTTGFFYLLSRGFSFFGLAFFGLWRLYVTNRNFFKINLMLFLIPLSIFVLPTSNYWDWRLFYFMPFLALVSILMSYLFEGKPEKKPE